MESFSKATSKLLPLDMSDVDTDMIIPAQYLTSIATGGYGEHVFTRLRAQDPSFPFNRADYRNRSILLVRENFGCGSSREHAVWALKEWGVRVIIGISFADIFAANSAKNGLVLISLAPDVIEKLFIQAASDCSVTVCLADQTVVTDNNDLINFRFDAFRKFCIISGVNDLDYILKVQDNISDFRSRQNPFLKPAIPEIGQ